MRSIIIAGLAIAAASCATAPPISTSTIFDPAEVSWFSQPGRNTIKGNAVLRTVGGEVRTCAGLDANLIPYSRYAGERFATMYGNQAKSGFLPATTSIRFAATDPAYQSASRTIRCDAQGNFTFENVPDGDYFITALVTWGVPMRYYTSTQGGYLMQRVEVRGGETKSLVLAVQ